MSTEPEAGNIANPYAAPVHEAGVEVAAPAVVSAYGYRDLTTLVHVLLGSLGLQTLSYVINGSACALLMLGGLDEQLQYEAVKLTEAVAQGSRAIYMLGLIPFGMFLVRANKNARAFLERSSDTPLSVTAFSPASMIWWFAVPILSLIRPYQAVLAVWESSAPLAPTAAVPMRDSILRVWWGCWLVDILSDRVAALVLKTGVEPELQNASVVVGAILGVANCMAALAMLRALHRRQQQRAAELWR